MDRRSFLSRTGGCVAHLALLDAAGCLGPELFAAVGPSRVVGQEPWGRLEEVAEGVWALVSTPLDDPLTLCNGGIVQGREAVLLVEAFGSPEGGVWMAEQARRLTGRWPDRVVVTHVHGDHVAGLSGLASLEHPLEAHFTAATRDDARRRASMADAAELSEALERITLIPDGRETRMDLGGRTVRVVPRSGHTPSDVTVELEDPSVVFCGDLVWNRYFPNYVDARPSELAESVRRLPQEAGTTYVPGHGGVAGREDLERYVRFIDAVEAHARASLEAGRSVEEAAESLTLPAPLDEWHLFGSAFPFRAVFAWYRELQADAG